MEIGKIISSMISWYRRFNSLWPSDAIWRHGSQSTLAQVMLVAWRHQGITWTNVDLSLVRSSDNHMRANSQNILQPWITKITTKITYLKFLSYLPGVSVEEFLISSVENEFVDICNQNHTGKCFFLYLKIVPQHSFLVNKTFLWLTEGHVDSCYQQNVYYSNGHQNKSLSYYRDYFDNDVTI